MFQATSISLQVVDADQLDPQMIGNVNINTDSQSAWSQGTLKAGASEYLVVPHDLFDLPGPGCNNQRSRFVALVNQSHPCNQAHSKYFKLQPYNLWIKAKADRMFERPDNTYLSSFGDLSDPLTNSTPSKVNFRSRQLISLNLTIPLADPHTQVFEDSAEVIQMTRHSVKRDDHLSIASLLYETVTTILDCTFSVDADPCISKLSTFFGTLGGFMFLKNDQKLDHCSFDADHLLPRPINDTHVACSAGLTEFMEQLIQFCVENQTTVMISFNIASTFCILLKLLIEIANNSVSRMAFSTPSAEMLMAYSSAPSFDSSKKLHLNKLSELDIMLFLSQLRIDPLVILGFKTAIKKARKNKPCNIHKRRASSMRVSSLWEAYSDVWAQLPSLGPSAKPSANKGNVYTMNVSQFKAFVTTDDLPLANDIYYARNLP